MRNYTMPKQLYAVQKFRKSALVQACIRVYICIVNVLEEKSCFYIQIS